MDEEVRIREDPEGYQAEIDTIFEMAEDCTDPVPAV